MQKLTKREKTLLYVLLYVIIISVAIFLLILPAKTTYIALQEERDQLQEELKTAQKAIINYGDLESEFAKVSEELDVQKLKFYSDYNVEDVDALLTSTVKLYGLLPINLNVAEIEKVPLMSYEDSKSVSLGEKSLEDVGATEIRVYNVTMNVSGSITNVQAFVNDANNLKSLRVAGLSYSINTLDQSISITFKLYVI